LAWKALPSRLTTLQKAFTNAQFQANPAGYGVKVILVGATFISKSGVTSTTFKAVPDNPVTSFELTLPEGPFSALGSNKNLCALTHAVTTKKTVKVKSHGKTKKVVKQRAWLCAERACGRTCSRTRG
jgi:hypothetical protein